MAAVLAGHRALLGADLPIFAVQTGGLGLGEFAFLDFLMDAPILVGEPLVDLLTTRMFLLPMGLGHDTGRDAGDRRGGECEGKEAMVQHRDSWMEVCCEP